MDDLRIDPRLTIPAAELEWSAARSSGPGGQNVNKVATKVELRFDVRQSPTLSDSLRARLELRLAAKLTSDGVLIVSSQSTRSQARNLEDAKAKLKETLLEALKTPKKRRKTKPTKGSKERRLSAKRKLSEKKKSRGGRFDD